MRMNGMTFAQWWAYTTDSDDFITTHQFEFPPTSTIAEISLVRYYEFDDQAHVELGFTACSRLDEQGVTRPETFPDIGAREPVVTFARNGLTSATIGMKVSNCWAICLVNFFFWDSVQ